jgi:hypothetical protein
MYLPSRHDPCPPLDRRWLRAGYLAEHRLDPSPEDDGWVRQAITFLFALTACPDEDARRRLGERMPAVSQAHSLRHVDPPLLRWVVEGRVLAREDFPTIARKCGLLPEAIAAYEALFFAVLSKLDAPSWIACQVIGRKLQTGMTEQDLDVLWRFAGYNYGPVMLDVLVHNTTSPLPPETPAEVAEVLAREAESLFARKRALAIQLLPITPETAPTVLNRPRTWDSSNSGRGEGRQQRKPPSPPFRPSPPACSQRWRLSSPARRARRGKRTGPTARLARRWKSWKPCCCRSVRPRAWQSERNAPSGLPRDRGCPC